MHWIIVGILIWIGFAIAPTVIGGGIQILISLAPFLIGAALLLIGGVLGAWFGAPNKMANGAAGGVLAVLAIIMAMWIWGLLNRPRKSAAEKREEAAQQLENEARQREAEAAYREQFRPRL